MAKKRNTLIEDLVDAIAALKELQAMDWVGKDNPILNDLIEQSIQNYHNQLFEALKPKKA
ncbi:MAG: hypothetical protein H8E17_03715 [Deltaproteobacteria bacterium]|nr:hypothetical protein [Deltaproteobacteria bacterium]